MELLDFRKDNHNASEKGEVFYNDMDVKSVFTELAKDMK